MQMAFSLTRGAGTGAVFCSGLALLAGLVVPARAQTATAVPVAAVQVKTVASGFVLDGVIAAVKQSTVSAQAAGRVVSVQVHPGDRVHKGQLLATIDDSEAQTGMQRSAAQMAQAQADLRNAQVQFERTRDLQSKGFLSPAALDLAESQLKSAQAGRDLATAGNKQSALAQAYTRVTAPFDGWVLQTMAEAGDLAVPGKPLLTLYAPTPLRAVVQVPVSRSALVRTADSVQVQLPGTSASARWVQPTAVSTVPSADPVAQTIEWRLDLSPQATPGVLPGQQVAVRFSGSAVQRTLVPASAILRRGELTAVYVVSGQGFALRAVRLGVDHGSDGVEVLAGLNPDERVALDPIRAGLSGSRADLAQ